MKNNILLLATLALAIALPVSAQTSFPNATTYPTLIVPIRSIATATTNGLVLQNPTTAATGAQQYSPGILWEGQGWGTTAPASAQVDFFAQVVPVQGTTPTANWVLRYATAGGSYSTVLTVSSAGVVTPGSGGFSGVINSVTGTPNQITASTTSGAVTLTLPAAIVAPGSVATTGSLGYTTGAGAGGAVTQLTSRTTGVTLNTPTGQITMFSAAGSTTAATFTVTDSSVAATDTIRLNEASGTNLYELFVTAVGAGSFNVTFLTTGGTATDAPVLNFAVIKGSAN